MEDSVIKLIIKSSSQEFEDQDVICNINWNIGQLKDHLSKVYPRNPEPKKQKLIYSGQLLDNLTCLKNIFKNYDKKDEIFVVHFICDTLDKSISKSKENGSQNIKKPENSQVFNTTEETVPSASLQYSQLNEHQIAWVHQAYAQYLNQYMESLSSQGNQLTNRNWYFQLSQNNVNNNTTLNDSSSSQNTSEHQINANQAEAANNQNNNNDNIVNNNGGEDGGVGNYRDWLDNFYMLSRIVILFSIVYFYSSPLRFLIVTFFCFLICLYHKGFFRTQAAVPVENNNAQPENNNQIVQDENRTPVQENAPENRLNENEFPIRTLQNNINREERPGALSFTCILFSFFASLVPDQPNIA